MYSLDSTDGSPKWHYLVAGQRLTTENNNFPSPPVEYGNVLYFVSSGTTVYALSLG